MESSQNALVFISKLYLEKEIDDDDRDKLKGINLSFSTLLCGF